MRERCWFIPEQVLKGKLPYRDFETFDGPPNPFLLAVVYYIGGIGLTPERATGFAYRLIFLGAMFCLARRWNSTVASGCTLFAALFLVSLGVAAYAWTGRLACALCSIYLLAQAESQQCGRGRCQWRASLPCGFWSRRNVVSITGLLAIPRREKLWCLFGAAAGLFPLGCLVLVIGPQPVLENLFVFPVLQSSASRHIRSQLWKSRLSFFSSHI